MSGLAQLFELRTPVGGDSHTVNALRVSLRADKATGDLFHSDHGPSLRALYDLGDPAMSRAMHSTGQSGIVFSPHYRSFLQSWNQAKYVPLWPQAGAAAKVLLVQPATR